MITCPQCSTQNLEGVFFCEECGVPLIGKDIRTSSLPMGTQRLTNATASPNTGVNVRLSGTTTLSKTTTIIIHFQEDNQRITLQQQAEVVIGRTDEKQKTYPDLDLTPHGALEKGVSRLHAAIRREDDKLLLVDLNSSNGTYLNGKQMIPNQPHILRDGDEIRFGKLVSHIYFKQ
jgi:pSer/pThr/pTyr-binding forkhead associated (FHA) protein